MAGQPKRRAKREQQQLADFPAAGTEGAGTGAHDARVREPARPYVPMRAAAAQPPGAETKRRADHAVADELQSLADELRPGITVRLERLRPGWAAGFLEEYPLQDGDLSELYDHVQTEHGGQLYKITVLNADGKAWYDSRIKVAGPPRERGRIIDRDAYEGVANPKAAPKQSPQSAPQAAAAGGMPDLMSVFSLVLQQQQKASEAQLEAVREMVGRQSDQTRELISTIVEQRGEDRRHSTISGQLEELTEAGKTMEKVRKMFGDSGEKSDDTDPIVKEAMSHFARSFFGSQSGQAPPQQQPRSRMPVTRRAPPDNVIPLAGADGEGGQG